MDYDASFAERQARAIGDNLRDLRDSVRDDIVAGAGFPVDPDTIRVRRREIRNEAYTVALAAVPASDADLRKILPGYPASSAAGPGASVSDDVREEARRHVADGIVEAVSSRIPAVVWEQYRCETPADFVEQLQPAVDRLAEVEPELADGFRAACSAMLAEDEVRTSDLAAPLEEMRKVLVHEGKMGNRAMLVAGRLVMEMADFLDGRHGLLDRAHVPAASPRH